MAYHLTGLSIASTASPIDTYEQLGGSGRVRNKALAIPAHLNRGADGPWASVEYVSLEPGTENAIGEHIQKTDEIYYLLEGQGTLTTNGAAERVKAGNLVIAPTGTIHAIANASETAPLAFLVVELQTSAGPPHAPCVLDLLARLHPGDAFAPVRVAGKLIAPRRAVLPLQDHASGSWGSLCLVELPPGARTDTYSEALADQLLVLSRFTSAIVTPQCPTEPERAAEEIRVDATGEGYHCLVIPPGVPRRIENRASGDYPALVLCLNVRHREQAVSQTKEEGHNE